MNDIFTIEIGCRAKISHCTVYQISSENVTATCGCRCEEQEGCEKHCQSCSLQANQVGLLNEYINTAIRNRYLGISKNPYLTLAKVYASIPVKACIC